MNHMEMDHKRCKIGPKTPQMFIAPLFLCTYYHILCSSLAYFAFLQRAPSDREGGWFSCLFQAKKKQTIFDKKNGYFSLILLKNGRFLGIRML